MLTELYLKNYILIKELKLSFRAGMTVITGETGAGKSILVGALNLVFGKAGTQKIAYDPKQDVYLELTFQIPSAQIEVHSFLEEIGFAADEGEIIVSREITAAGKSTSYLNGRKTSIAVLKEMHDLLIDFHHQRDQQNLLSKSFQLDILDRYGNLILQRTDFRNSYQELKSTMQALKGLQDADELSKQMAELYRFQLDEINSANLTIGEDNELQQDYEFLSHSEEILTLAEEAHQNIYEQENSLYDSLSRILTQIAKFSTMSPNIKEICSKLETSLEGIQDVSSQLRALKEQISSDPERLNNVRQRLDLINNLKVKYKLNTLTEILAYRDKINQTVESQDNRAEEIQALEKQIESLFQALLVKADALSEKRQQTALKLSDSILKNIRFLSIPQAGFEIQIDKKAKAKIILTEMNKVLSDSGQDVVEFMFSANVGSPIQPLKEIVSGGELSRILLATKKSLAQVMPPRTMILDEIDSGIGGKTAGSMADFIHGLSESYQVICITHLAQIAARADNHVSIEKKSKQKQTLIEVGYLDELSRVTEIARMLSGHITDTSVSHARELLKKA
ncbi:MAG: DNA repair protein RecN [Candidatus Cloacimonadaceae bacterium]